MTTSTVYVSCIGLLSDLTYDHFWKFLTGRYIDDIVNKTPHDKGRACAKEKRKRCNQISSDIILGRNYPTAGYTYFVKVHMFYQTALQSSENIIKT